MGFTLRTLFTEGITSSGFDCKFMVYPFLTNSSFAMFPEISLSASQVSISEYFEGEYRNHIFLHL